MQITTTWFTIIVGLYTLVILIGINYYERKLDVETRKVIFLTGSDYDEPKNMKSLDKDNQALKAQIQDLKATLADYQRAYNLSKNRAGSQDIQYESHTYKNNTWDSIYANYTELKLEPYNQDEIDFDK
jgi:cell division protein FtsB